MFIFILVTNHFIDLHSLDNSSPFLSLQALGVSGSHQLQVLEFGAWPPSLQMVFGGPWKLAGL